MALLTSLVAPKVIGAVANKFGLNAKAPAPASTAPKLPPSQQNSQNIPLMSGSANQNSGGASKPSSSFNSGTLAQQASMNKANAGQAGWVPLKEDGIMGPKTQAAMSFKPTAQSNPLEYQKYQSTPTETPKPAPVAATPKVEPTQNQALLTSLANRGKSSTNEYEAATGKANEYLDKLTASQLAEAKTLANNASNPIPIEFQQGRARVLQDQYNQEQAALGSAYQAATAQQAQANTQQQLQQSALGTAAGFTQPQMQFGQLTDPQTGKVIGGGSNGNNPQLNSAVSNAMSIINAGGSYDDAKSSLSAFGALGEQTLLNALNQGGTGFNPTSYDAQVSANLGQGQNFQQQASTISTALQSIDAIEPNLLNALTSSGLNPNTLPWQNKQINTYMAEVGNPAAAASVKEMLANVKRFNAQIVGTSGINPTAIGDTLDNFDPGLMTAAQLQSFLANLKNTGQANLGVLQKNMSASYGTPKTTAYAGPKATPSTQNSFLPETQTPITGNTAAQTWLGATVNSLGFIKNLGANLVNGLFH